MGVHGGVVSYAWGSVNLGLAASLCVFFIVTRGSPANMIAHQRMKRRIRIWKRSTSHFISSSTRFLACTGPVRQKHIIAHSILYENIKMNFRNGA